MRRQEYLSFDSGRREPGAGIREARRLRAQLVADIAGGKYGGARGTLAHLVTAYVDHRAKAGASPTTVSGYRSIAKAIAAGPGRKRLDRLTAHDLDAWYADLQASGVSAARIQHYHRLVSAALAQGERWDWCNRNVARLATPPKAQRPEFVVPPPERVVALIELAAASRAPDMAGVIITAALTGLRRGELCGLRWSDVEIHDDPKSGGLETTGTLNVRRSVWQASKRWGIKDPKSHQSRIVHVGPRVMTALGVVRRRQAELADRAGVPLDDDPFVFSTEPGGAAPKMPGAITRAFSRYCETLAGDGEPWPYRFHDLRHYQASELIAAGHSMVTVSKRLGHAKVSTTVDIYAHDSDDQARAAAGALDSGLSG